MKTAELFTGKAFIEVHEGSTFRIDNNWSWTQDSTVIFQVKAGVRVKTNVKAIDRLGTEFVVVDIIADDALGKVMVESKEVEVETTPHDDKILESNEVEDTVEEIETEYKLLLDKKKFTKREIVSFIESNGIDIDTKLSKSNLIKALEERDLVEYK